MLIIVALLALGLVLAGAAVFLVLRDAIGGDEAGDGPADLREPLTFQQVEEATPPPCGSGTVPDAAGATCFRLGPERMAVHRVERIEAMPPGPETGQSRWSVRLELTSSDGEAFERLSGRAAERPQDADGRRIAMMVGGRVLSAPMVTGPVAGGEVMISGDFTRSDAEGLVRTMTGAGG